MKKEKVFVFFVLLMIFVVTLMYLRMSIYGGVLGMAVYSGAENNPVSISQSLIYAILLIACIFVLFYAAKFLYNYNQRVNMLRERHFEKKLIKIDF